MASTTYVTSTQAQLCLASPRSMQEMQPEIRPQRRLHVIKNRPPSSKRQYPVKERSPNGKLSYKDHTKVVGHLNQTLAVLDTTRKRSLSSERLDTDKPPVKHNNHGKHSSISFLRLRSHSAERHRSAVQGHSSKDGKSLQWVSVIERLSGKPKTETPPLNLNIQHLEAATNSRVSRKKTRERIRSTLVSPASTDKKYNKSKNTQAECDSKIRKELDCASLYNLYESLQTEHLVVSKLNPQQSENNRIIKSDKSRSRTESLSGKCLRNAFASSNNGNSNPSASPRNPRLSKQSGTSSNIAETKMFMPHTRNSFQINNSCDCESPQDIKDTSIVEDIDSSTSFDSDKWSENAFEENPHTNSMDGDTSEHIVPPISVSIKSTTSKPAYPQRDRTVYDTKYNTDEPDLYSTNISMKATAPPASSYHEDDRIHFHGNEKEILTYYNNDERCDYSQHQLRLAGSLKTRSKSAPPRNRNNKMLNLNSNLPSTQAPPPSPSGSYTNLDQISTSTFNQEKSLPNQYKQQPLAPSALEGVYVNLSYVKIHSPLLVPPPGEDAGNKTLRPASANIKRGHVVKEIPQTMNHHCVFYTGAPFQPKPPESKAASTMDTNLQLIGKACVKS